MACYGSSSSASSDPRSRLGRSDRSAGYDAGRHSGLRDEVSFDSRSAREQQQAALEYAMRRQQEQQERQRSRRRSGRDEYGEYSGWSGRRGAVTAANDEYLAYVQAAREQQQREHDERPRNVQRYGRGYFPAYEFR